MSREAGELLRHRLLQPGGAKEARSMVEDLLLPSARASKTAVGGGGSKPGSDGDAGGRGALCRAAGGFYPDPSAMLRQQGLLA